MNALKKISSFMSSIVNFILLLFVYFLGGSISFVIIKATGKTLFGKFNEECDSFWSEREKEKEDNLYRQF